MIGETQFEKNCFPKCKLREILNSGSKTASRWFLRGFWRVSRNSAKHFSSEISWFYEHEEPLNINMRYHCVSREILQVPGSSSPVPALDFCLTMWIIPKNILDALSSLTRRHRVAQFPSALIHEFEFSNSPLPQFIQFPPFSTARDTRRDARYHWEFYSIPHFRPEGRSVTPNPLNQDTLLRSKEKQKCGWQCTSQP